MSGTIDTSLDLFERVVRAQGVAYSEWTPGEDRIHASPALAALFDLDPEDWTVQRLMDHIHPHDAVGYRAALTAFMKSDADRTEIAVRYRRRDGGMCWILNHNYAERDPSGRVTRLTTTSTDITQEKQREAENVALLARQAASVEVLKAITASPDDPQPVFDLIVRRACELCNAQAGNLVEYDGTLMHQRTLRGFAPEAEERLRAVFPRAPGLDTLPGRVVLTGQRVHLPDAQADQGLIQQGRGLGARGFLGVPLLREGQVIGVLGLARFDPGEYDQTAIELVQSFAEQAVVAIAGAKTLRELRDRTAQLAERNDAYSERIEHQSATIDVLKAMSASPGDAQPVFDLIAERARDICGGYGVTVTEFDGTLIHHRASTGVSEDPAIRDAAKAAYPMPLSRDRPVGRAILDNEICHLRDHDTEPGLLRVPHYDTVKSSVTVPLMRGGMSIGALAMGSRQRGGFSDTQVELLKTFAEQAVIAMSSADTYRALETRTADLQESLEYQTATSDVLKVISRSTFDLRPTMETLLATATRLCGAEGGTISLRDGDDFRGFASSHPSAEFNAAFPGRLITPGGTAMRAVRAKQVVQIEDVTAEPGYDSPQTATSTIYRSVIGVPLMREDVAIGVIVLGRSQVQRYTERHVALLSIFADQAVIAIENTRLITEQQEALEQQTATAEVLQVINASPGDLVPVFRAILDKAHGLCGAAIGSIATYDGEFMHPMATHGYPDAYEAHARQPFRPSAAGAQRLIGGARLLHFPDMQAIRPRLEGQGGILIERTGLRTRLSVPLRMDGAFLGQITAYRTEVRPFSEKEIALLENFAAQAVIAMENARLLSELRERTAELAERNDAYSERIEHQSATIDVLKAMSASPGDAQPVFDLIAERARDICGGYGVSIYEYDGALMHLRAYAGISEDPAVRAIYEARYPMRPAREAIAGRVILDGRPIRIDDYDLDSETRRTSSDGTVNSAAAVPMMRGGTVIGALGIGNREKSGFSDSQVELLKTFAEQAVIAISSADTYRALETRTADLQESLEYQTATSDVLKVISRSTFDLQPVLDTVIEKAVQLCDAELGILAMRDGDLYRVEAAFGDSPDVRAAWLGRVTPIFRGSLTGRAALEGRFVHVADISADPEYNNLDANADAVAMSRLGTGLGMPLLRDGVVVGVISVIRHRVEVFTDRQIDLVSTFADQAVIAIENTRLLTEQQEALEQQTATAEVLQVINTSPGNLTPVFDTMLEKAMRLCGVASGLLAAWDGHHSRVVAVRGLPPALVDYMAARGPTSTPTPTVMSVLETKHPRQLPDMMAGEGYRTGHPDARAIVDLGGVRAVLFVPLVKDEAAVGYFAFNRQEARAFSDKEIALLENFAAQAVIAMENARLLTETREALEQQTAMAEVLQVINASAGNLTPVFDVMLEKAMNLCGVSFGRLQRWDGELIHNVAVRGLPPALAEWEANNQVRPAGPAALRIFETKRPHHILDVRQDEGYLAGHPSMRAFADFGGGRTCLLVPLLKDGAVLGYIHVFRQEVRAFSDKEIALLENFAAQAVIAMENARLLNEQREALEVQTATAEIMRAINASPGNLTPVFQLMVDRALQLCGASFGSMGKAEGDLYTTLAVSGMPAEYAQLRVNVPARHGPGTTLWSMQRGADVEHYPDLMATEGYRNNVPVRRGLVDVGGARASVAVALRKDDAVLGMMSIFRREPGPFSEKQISRLRNFADQAVIAMENARLINEQREALEQQTATAEVLQVINASPGDLAPVFNAILEKSMRLCEAAFGAVFAYDGEHLLPAAMQGLPAALADYNSSNSAQQPTLLALQVIGAKRSILTLDLRASEGYRAGHPGPRAIVELGGARTMLLVPLLKEQAVVGIIQLYRQEVQAFTEKQIALLENFAAQAVIAMENARLINETQEALARQTATAEVLQVINASPGDLTPVFNTIVEKAHALCGASVGSLMVYDGAIFRAVATHGYQTETEALLRRGVAPTGFHEPLFRGERIRVRDAGTHDWSSQHDDVRAYFEKSGVNSILVIPLRKEGTLLGYITNASFEARSFSDKEVTLLENFAEQAVIAMENARLLGELQDRTATLAQRNSEFGERIEQQAATIDVLKVMSSTPDDTQPVFDQIVRRAKELCNGDSAVLFPLREGLVHFGAMCSDRDLNTPAMASYLAEFPMAPTRGSIICRTILDSQVIHIKDIQAESGLSQSVRALIKDGNYRSQVAIPLMRDGQAIGCISLTAAKLGGFTDSQISLLQTFAEQAVIAIGSVATFRALRERTAELAQRQEELRVTFENMGDGVAMFDETQHLVAWNRKFQDLLEVPNDIIAQRRSLPDYVRYLAERGEFGTGADVDEQVRRVLQTTGQMRVFERIRPNGNVIEVHSNPIAGGGFVLIYSDITERRRNEEAIRAARDAAEDASRTIEAAFRELKTAQANLIQAEKMASLGQLTAGIAHEIKNPLNFVNNFAALSVDLLAELKETAAPGFAALTEAQRAEIDDVSAMLTGNLQKITEHGKRADGIVKAMLEHSRGASGERRTVDINTLVDEALNLAYHGARAQDQSFNMALERDFGDGITPIEVNPQDMTRVLLNLFSNGFYAASQRASSGEHRGFEPTLRVTTRAAGDAVEIRVRDNGTGISVDIRDKLFQPFFTTKPSGQGTGLGLSITYDIVTKAHGGMITVDSKVGEFTEFLVTLPRGIFAQQGSRT